MPMCCCSAQSNWADPGGRRFRIGVQLRSESGAWLGELPALPLPGAVLAAGGRARIPLDGRAPDAPGRYRLLIDVVEEGVTWFSERGSAPVAIELEVREAASGDWSATATATAASRALLGEEPTRPELELWAGQLQCGTPTATWISWLAERLAPALAETATARALAASFAPLGLAEPAAQSGTGSGLRRG